MFAIITQPLHGPPLPPHSNEKLTQEYEVTAYTAGAESTGKSRNHPLYGVTASGERVEEGVTVSCPREMPLGTRIDIEGVGERVCKDRGGAIRGKRLDLYVANVKVARKFGRQTLKVTVVETP